MHRSPCTFASARPRGSGARRTRNSLRTQAAHRGPLEALENRVLFAAGDFDTTFGGGDGAALINFAPASTDTGTNVAITADNKLIVGGSVGNGTKNVFGLTRLNPDGSIDLTFGGGDGLATLDFGTSADLNSLALTSDGRIVAVGRVGGATGSDWAVARFNADGSPDTTFSGDGMTTTDFFGFGDTAYGVDVQPDGKIVATGTASRVTADLAVARYNLDGSLDTSFDGDGIVFEDVFGGADDAASVKVQADKKIIVVGGSVLPGSYRQFSMMRLNPDGTFDTSFSSDGVVDNADFGAGAFAKDVEIQSDGKYVVGGFLDSNPVGDDQLDFTVARFNANGTLDTSFGRGGRASVPNTGGDALYFYGLDLQQNGKILLGGTIKDPNFGSNGRTSAGVARFNANGLPDITFGPGGLRQFPIPGADAGSSRISDLEEQSDGKIVLAGAGTTGGTSDFAVVRLLNDDGPPPLPGSISGVVFNDANQNGLRDPGEAGLPGWTVYQDANNNGVLDTAPVTTLSSTDVPKVIPRFPPQLPFKVTSTLNVSGVSGSISDLNVMVNIAHTWDEDLTVTLISPDGQRVELFSGVGGNGDNFINTVLDDEATVPIKEGSPPFSDKFQPEEALSAFDNTNPNGIWQLEVVDDGDDDGGQLNNWSLIMTTTGEASVVTGADGSYTFPKVDPGTYTVREVVQPGWTQTTATQVVDVASGQAVTGKDFGNFNGVLASAVVGRRVFYNNSAFDGKNPAANAQDDAAIATDKTALLPLQTSASGNITSYDKGINGVMIDMTRMNSNLEADDFEFRMGTQGSPALWSLAPAPLSVTERSSGSADGSTRVTIIWADNAIRNQWLEVTVKANADTHLTSQDVFYFGNLVGETVPQSGVSGSYVVDGNDLLATRAARQAAAVPITSPADHNRDGRLNVLDEMIVRGGIGNSLVELIRPRNELGASGAASVGNVDPRRRTAPVSRSVLA